MRVTITLKIDTVVAIITKTTKTATSISNQRQWGANRDDNHNKEFGSAVKKEQVSHQRVNTGDEILKSLASRTKTVTPLLVRLLVSKHSNTTAQRASCHQASHIHSNIPHLNHLLARIAYPVS